MRHGKSAPAEETIGTSPYHGKENGDQEGQKGDQGGANTQPGRESMVQGEVERVRNQTIQALLVCLRVWSSSH